MELTSVLLRCVHSEFFGIYSPPLLCLLQVPIAEPVLHDLAYCDELAAWGHQFLPKRSVGETDRALWVFYERVYGPRADPEKREECQKTFRENLWVRKRHADNSLGRFFQQYSPLEQAAFLIGIDNNLAGKIAGCEFEARWHDLVSDREFRGDLVALIDYVDEHIDCGLQKQELHTVRKLRNRAI